MGSQSHICEGRSILFYLITSTGLPMPLVYRTPLAFSIPGSDEPRAFILMPSPLSAQLASPSYSDSSLTSPPWREFLQPKESSLPSNLTSSPSLPLLGNTNH